MKFKKVISVFLCCILATSILSGCSDKKEDKPNQQTPELTISFDLSKFLDENGYIKDFDPSVVTLPDYKSIVIPKSQYTPSQESINSFIDSMVANLGKTETVKKGIVPDGATLNIDYVGSVDGVEFEGGSTGGQGTDVTIGVTQYIEGFLEQLVGKEVGSTFDINVTFPENYHNTELAGKDAVFKITINSMEVAPEITDEFCKENFEEFPTKSDLINFATTTLSDRLISQYMYLEVFGKSTVKEINQNAINFQNDYILANYEALAQQYGTTLDELLKTEGFESQEAFLQKNADMIRGAAEELMVIQAIAKQENLTITDEDLIQEYEGEENYKKAEEFYGKNFLKMAVMQKKVITLLDKDTPREQ